jgi:hypothetical protein
MAEILLKAALNILNQINPIVLAVKQTLSKRGN